MEAGLRRNWLHLKWCSQFQCRRPSHLCNSYAFPDTADFVIYTHYCISWESSACLTLVTILSTPVWYRCAWKGIMAWLTLVKGLRPVLEGFVVTMHEGACETGSQIPRALARGIWRTVRTNRVHCDNKPRQIGLNHDYNMTFSISPREC